MAQLKKLKEVFKSRDGTKSQLRAYPADPNCKHNVSKGECFCTDKCAEHMQECVAEWQEDCEGNNGQDWEATDQGAPFHSSVVDVAKACTYSTTAHPVIAGIPQHRRVPGIWHCIHNCRHAMWVLLKDMAGKYCLLDALKLAMTDIGLPNIKVAPTDRKSKAGGFSSVEGVMISEIAEGVRIKAVQDEEKNEGNDRTSMDGNELINVMANFEKIVAVMEAHGIPEEHQWRWDEFKLHMGKALTSFNAGAAIALADIWLDDQSQQMGENFRAWADTIIDNLGMGIGLPYEGRTYLDILPAHWLCEPDHLEAHARRNFGELGITPGSLSDGPCEAGEQQIQPENLFCGLVFAFRTFCCPRCYLSVVADSQPAPEAHADPWARKQCGWENLEQHQTQRQ